MSSLFNQASLILVPSGYKAGKVYSQVPTNGDGDLTFTRASDATRVNSAGLIEIPRTNLLRYSEQPTNAAWGKQNSGTTFTLTDNFTIAPNGTTTACKYTWTAMDSAGKYFSVLQACTNSVGDLPVTFSVYMKGALGGEKLYIYGNGYESLQLLTLTTEWVRYQITYDTSAASIVSFIGGEFGVAGMTTLLAGTAYVWGAQLEEGSTATDYIPTTNSARTTFAGITQDGTSASNVARLDYSGGSCPKLLLEPQRTNLVTYSEQFDNANWGKVSATITANTTISPDGTQNADTFTTTGGGARIFQTFSLGAGSYTTSLYVKKLSGSGDMRFFGIVDGGGVSQSFTPTDNWQKFTGNFTASTGITELQLRENGFSGSIAIWGFQLEAGTYPTSYIPTTSSAATRVADAAYKTGISSLIGQTEGTMFAEIDLNLAGSNIGYYALQLYDSASSPTYQKAAYIELYQGKVYGYVRNTTIQCEIISSTYADNTRLKIALAYKANDFALYVNGVQIGTDASGSLPSVLNSLSLHYSASTQQGSPLHQALLFPTRLTNSELASITGNQNYTINQAYASYGVASESPNCVLP